MAEKLPGIPQEGYLWRVIQLRPKGWRTWLIASGNERMEGGPFLHPETDEQAAQKIFRAVKREWPEKTWAIINPAHEFVARHDGR